MTVMCGYSKEHMHTTRSSLVRVKPMAVVADFWDLHLARQVGGSTTEGRPTMAVWPKKAVGINIFNACIDKFRNQI